MFRYHPGAFVAAESPSDGNNGESTSHGSTIEICDMTSEEVVQILEGHIAGDNAMAYLPCGTHIAYGFRDNSVRVWNLCTQEEAGVFNGHTSAILSVAYCPDGTRVVSGSNDSTVRVWDISPDHHLRYIRQENPDGEHTGWLLYPNDSSAHLMFIPPAEGLPDDSNVLTFPSSAVPHLDISNAKLGDRWTECYTPTS